MNRILPALMTLAIAAMWSGAALADSRPVLRSQVTTLSEIVTVGDFYSNAGATSDTPLFRSPDMGTKGDVPADLVAKRARAAGLTEAGTDGLRKVIVHRRAERFDSDRLAALIRDSIAAQDATLDPDEVDVTFFHRQNEIVANPNAPAPVRVDSIHWTRSSGQFAATLTVAGERSERQIVLNGRALEMIEFVSLMQPLRRGGVLKESDLTTIRLARSKVPANALTDPASIIGLAARNNIRSGAPLARKDFEHPVLISRGDKVTVSFQMPGMKLTTRAQALMDGAAGDVIDVKNLQSRRIVPATVLSRGQVRVDAANPTIASLTNEAI